MSIFNRLFDQANPFDGGKTFNSRPQQPQRQPRYEDGSAQVGPIRVPSPYQQNLPQRPSRPMYGGELQGNNLRMYEDQTFSGDPRAFGAMNPQYRFYEDNSFSPPDQLQEQGNLRNLLRLLMGN